jgi:dipeptidase E
MRLVLYSGGQNRSNQRLHRSLVDLARSSSPRGKKRDLRLTYLPFCADDAHKFFLRSVRRYHRYGVDEFCCLQADCAPTREQIKAAFDTDIVYLAGGNTFYFLKHLRESGILPELRRFARNGGVIAGLSAGAHILTPTVELAGAPGLDPDRNSVRLKNLTGLGLVGFEFLPHFEPNRKQIAALLRYSRKTSRTIYACSDGGGLVIEGKRITAMGKVHAFYRGIRMQLT